MDLVLGRRRRKFPPPCGPFAACAAESQAAEVPGSRAAGRMAAPGFTPRVNTKALGDAKRRGMLGLPARIGRGRGVQLWWTNQRLS